ncbi:hypothetical protein [Mesorhizobium sp. ANAO-SY3R2]|uniref:hypothetical protein n=1 Tax=Mesorhizobium sp. ANAO-SY3R2 TaxID=3166644 RepID=UPI00366E0CD1
MNTAELPPTPPSVPSPLLTLAWDQAAWTFTLTVSIWLILGLMLVAVTFLFWKWWSGGFTFRSFEIDQAEIGVGNNKFRFKPNLTDKQIAYAIWVELSTRKIGLPIDFEHDVIAEIYDSWFTFFSVTRDLVKGVPVNQVKRTSTQAIIRLSIEVLNEGLRPHLTRWQARFRYWHERELKKYDGDEGSIVFDPQQIQSNFPQYVELKEDMERVNQALIRYRRKMYQLVLKD